MFGSRRGGTVIAEGLKIVGSVTAEGLVEVNGQIEGELHCTSLIVSRKAQVAGTILAERVVVDGRVEGPIQGGEVVLKSASAMSSAIFTTNLWPLRRAPISRAAQYKHMEPTGASPIELAKGCSGRPRATAARPMLAEQAADRFQTVYPHWPSSKTSQPLVK